MELKDALTITVLGIGVVFVGLLLTNLMIHSFSILPKLSRLFSRSGVEKNTAVETTEAAEVGESSAAPVGPEIMAVITTVLEVELRIRSSLTEGKFTFK